MKCKPCFKIIFLETQIQNILRFCIIKCDCMIIMFRAQIHQDTSQPKAPAVQDHSPLSWSVSTWSACSIFSADWYKKTGFSNRIGYCLLLPKTNTVTHKDRDDSWKGHSIGWPSPGGRLSRRHRGFTHQALSCELRHLMDGTVGKVQHTYTVVRAHTDPRKES